MRDDGIKFQIADLRFQIGLGPSVFGFGPTVDSVRLFEAKDRRPKANLQSEI